LELGFCVNILSIFYRPRRFWVHGGSTFHSISTFDVLKLLFAARSWALPVIIALAATFNNTNCDHNYDDSHDGDDGLRWAVGFTHPNAHVALTHKATMPRRPQKAHSLTADADADAWGLCSTAIERYVSDAKGTGL